MFSRCSYPRKIAFLVVFAALASIAAFACGNSAVTEQSYERVIARDGVLTISDFEAVGIKTVRQYDVSELPAATDAWFGFRRASDIDPADFELRFYPDHPSAVSDGIFYAEDVTGKDANILSTNAAWKEGIRDRQASMFFKRPKYFDYAVYGNVIMLCEGIDVSGSLHNCQWLIDAIDAMHTSNG